jgi:single-strand DNA-binding protein
VVWGKQAEACGEYLAKGRPVLVEGRLVQRSWETPEGQKRSKHEVVADRVQFLDARPAPSGSPAAEEELPRPAPTDEEVPF